MRDYLYVDDVINAIEIILNKGKSKMIYNIGTTNELNVLGIAKYTYLEKLDPDWNEQVSFEQGLEKTIMPSLWYLRYVCILFSNLH